MTITLGPAARMVAVAIVGVTLLGALLTVGDHDASRALVALWRGSFGSTYALTSATLVRAIPLIVAGLAVALAFRSGVYNIGAEGQLLVGAAAGAAVGLFAATTFGRASVVLVLAAGALSGALWAGIAAWLRLRYRVLEVISTMMLNFLAIHLIGWLVRGPLQEPTGIYPQSSTLDVVSRLPRLAPGARVHVGILLAIAAAIALWWVLRTTAAGFRLRVAGASPDAARIAGLVRVDRTTAGAFVISGALAGVAGAVEVSGVTYALYENISPGYGYTAIAVALLARLNPLGVLVTGTLFGALDAGSTAMQRDAGVPSVVVTVVQAVVILLVLALECARRDRLRVAEAGT